MVLPVQFVRPHAGLSPHDAWCINVIGTSAALGVFGVIYGAVVDTAFKALGMETVNTKKAMIIFIKIFGAIPFGGPY